MNKNVVAEKIINELVKEGYDCAVAVATEAEIEAKAACGQIAFENEV
jgi:adenine C2-methylase RlmN of 23S rRNA A2503 and tRNA A37